ncbi:MAG: prepilin-type N-terminal cleavage/methylation domain-containing protein [Pseudomonadales bacterium]|uniref:MSHA pilin protein MshD n=1 Tax=Oleiphilus messinensis TaxID=141451 RepID=A0A1Y0I335_9GAMM|nr:prepilin-type N-terminal cleavage/methylation domain-containing protein [Oleiphilus messinensis]ARU54821.1 MSHA pilin protein MshD [Oleiphilus messinensis]MCG8610601.1 prepilin-type N-terminal cleavage/methylation domain-containing protein [Pseudomonadales bacterium]
MTSVTPHHATGSASCTKAKGVTLVELVITIVIISIAIVGVISAFSSSVGRSADPLWQFKSLKLAQFYLDEIQAKAFDESTPLGGVPPSTSIDCGSLGPEEANRDEFDDVDDYIMANQAPAILSTSGMVLDSSYQDYRITITVSCDGTALGFATNDRVKRITLTVVPPESIANADTMQFTLYRSNF